MGYGNSNLDGSNMLLHTGKSSSSTSHCCLMSWLKRGRVRSNGQFEVLSTTEIYPYAMEASNVGLRFMSKTIFILDLL